MDTHQKFQSCRAIWLNLSWGQFGNADKQKEKDTVRGNWERAVRGHERNDEGLIWEGGRRDRKERVKSHWEVDSPELSSGLDWQGENGVKDDSSLQTGSRMNREAANNKDEECGSKDRLGGPKK